jgi:hypothetical protein
MGRRRHTTAGNSRFLIERFTSRIPGFNRRRLSLPDLAGLCEPQGIEIVYLPMRRLHGVAHEDGGYRYLYINSLIPATEQVINGYHEYTHITDHVLDVEPFKSTGNLWNLPKYERQAWIIGVLAWMPEPLAWGLSVEQLMQGFGVRREIAEFRASLNI